MNKKKVVFYSIIPSPYQRDLFLEISRCKELDLKVYYLEPACSDSPWPEKPLQPYEQILPGFHLSWGLSRFHFNWHSLSTNQADMIVLNGYMNLTTQIILRMQAKKIPCIFWGEKMIGSSEGMKEKLQKYIAQSLNNCSAIVAIGKQAQQDYQQKFPGKPVFNIPYYCEISHFSRKIPHRPRNPVTILFCGQMIVRKGVDILLQAFNNLIQTGENAKLLLVGREAELPQLLENLPQKTLQAIEYVGFQAPENLPQFFYQADLFVLPSRYDGWGVVVNQAIGAGLPVICSDGVGSGYDLVTSSENGDIFTNGNCKALTEVLRKYLHQPDKIENASAASLRKAADLSPAIGARKWVNLFDKITLNYLK
ncbi:MAG: glycosyltransferase family 4 protein [Sphaerospermopsis sp. SIO1G2]|nr:glycosyltransferase family 4 protein [Sphaerospermopsis sp. SIO1G2]